MRRLLDEDELRTFEEVVLINFKLLIVDAVVAVFEGTKAFMSMRSFISNERPILVSHEAADLGESPPLGRVGEASCVGDDMEEEEDDATADDDEEEEEDVEGVSRPVLDDERDDDRSDVEVVDAESLEGTLSDFSFIMLDMDRSAHQCSISKATKPVKWGYSAEASSTCL